MCKSALAMLYIQWCTCSGNCYPIEIPVTLTHMRYHLKAHEIPKLMVKIGRESRVKVIISHVEISVASNLNTSNVWQGLYKVGRASAVQGTGVKDRICWLRKECVGNFWLPSISPSRRVVEGCQVRCQGIC